jgi:hypothetical protein
VTYNSAQRMLMKANHMQERNHKKNERNQDVLLHRSMIGPLMWPWCLTL